MSKLSLKVYGKKAGMTMSFNDKGEVQALTIIKIENLCLLKREMGITNSNTLSIEGNYNLDLSNYNKYWLGSFIDKKPYKAYSCHVKKNFLIDKKVPKKIKESILFKDNEPSFLKNTGSLVLSEIFSVGQKINIQGKTKGKGFSGGMKEHNFRGIGSRSNIPLVHRAIGSTGINGHSHTAKGCKMPRRGGGNLVTVNNLIVNFVGEDFLAIHGAVPGNKNSFVKIEI